VKTITSAILLGLLVLTSSNAFAAQPANATPSKLVTLPNGRVLTPWEQHMIDVYRADASRIDSLESPGDSGSGAGAGSGGDAGGAGSGGCR
jgi:hypothetical protein